MQAAQERLHATSDAHVGGHQRANPCSEDLASMMMDKANYILSLNVERRNILRLAYKANFLKIVRTTEKREKAFHQFLACGGTAGYGTLLIRPRGQGSAQPSHPYLLLEAMARLLLSNLVEEPFDRASSSCPKAKVAQTTRSTNIVEFSPPPPPLGPALDGHSIIIDPQSRRIPPPCRSLGKGAQKSSHRACSAIR
uniref:Uncharacterized protein n=1 Tax=Cannabis sativa TaxID=3483 RepID=A0A803PSB0_CANSA